MNSPPRVPLEPLHESQTDKGLSASKTSKESQGGQAQKADPLEEIDNE
jgi:hypothetical protein